MLAPAAHGGTGGTTPGGGSSAARLQGTWSMNARVTRATNVRGEKKGQRFKRRWTFTSSCVSGPCSTVKLRRERSNKQFDTITLTRAGSTYSGSGKFYLRLRCGGKTYKRGGVARYTIKLKVTKTRSVQGTKFATRVSATYTNARRVNRTPCAGSLGRDAGTYSGKLTSPFPKPPSAAMSYTNSGSKFDFMDASTDGTARIVAWSWNFGDASPKERTRDASHTYGAAGPYTVRLIVRDSNGLTDSLDKKVTVR
jgi:hypothetical protein